MKIKLVVPFQEFLMIVTEDGKLYQATFTRFGGGWSLVEIPLPQ